MEKPYMYNNTENIHIVVDVLKKHGICHLVISPGGTNIPLIEAIQDDVFFTCYSIVDERSALYFAIGLYLQIRKPIATLCTSAQAARNYVPGLTEAFYKRIPILAITMEKHPRFLYQEYMQAPDQTSLPKDSVRKSFGLPFISDINDVYHSIRIANEAVLELDRNGCGPVQLCIPWLDFPLKNIKPSIKCIKRYTSTNLKQVNLENRKVLIVIGEHIPFNSVEKEVISNFCSSTNSAIYVNHLSNFANSYCINANLFLSVATEEEIADIWPDVLISIGGQTGDYPFFLTFSDNKRASFEHWRICDDGLVVDTYDKLTNIFQCSLAEFFYSVKGECTNHSYLKCWKQKTETLSCDIDVPFSNVSVAAYLHNKIPKNSIMQFSILHSLRVWNLFDLDSTIECYSNVGAFGIDGGMSTLLGQSVATSKLSFMIIGDLAFFYDMNSLGIRHLKNNIRILLVNNNGGAEFKLYGGNNSDINRYIAAGNHYKDARGWALTCGFDYYSADTMSDFVTKCSCLLIESAKPILFELFISDSCESEAYHMLLEANRTKSTTEHVKYKFKKTVKDFLKEDTYNQLKKRLKNND